MTHSIEPLVCIAASLMEVANGRYAAHGTGQTVVRSVSEFANCEPLLLPGIKDYYDCDRLADRIDLAAALNGGRICDCSDACFSHPENLLLPDPGVHMGEGWETRRRRGEGHDWCIVQLGARGIIETVEVDTRHFKGNYPHCFNLEVSDGQTNWIELLPQTELQADHVQLFELVDAPPCTHARFNIYPDGGVGRLRLYGRPA